MQNVRTFKITTPTNPNGVVYTYHSVSELFISIEILEENMNASTRTMLINQIRLHLNNFLEWAQDIVKRTEHAECIELATTITFDMMWKLYNHPASSKKKSRIKWDKMPQEEQIKAYYFYNKYNKLRGSAEKKYLTTYLNDELWNN